MVEKVMWACRRGDPHLGAEAEDRVENGTDRVGQGRPSMMETGLRIV
jgi:hypothetical protein